MRQVAIGAVVAFVLTVIVLSVWKPSAAEVTPASPPASPQLMVAPVPANRRFVAPPPVLPARIAAGDATQKVRPMPVLHDVGPTIPGARFIAADAGTP